jgi:3-phenylpropionate/cinnamic acid dioxygenase small subunit
MIGLMRVATITPKRARRGLHPRGLADRLRSLEPPAFRGGRIDDLSLGDRLAIADLITEYAWLVDHDRWLQVPALFTDSAVLTIRGHTIAGRASIATWAADQAAGRTSRTQHQITNVRIAPAGRAHATATATLVAHVALTGRRTTHVDFVAELQDELVKTATGWRISARRVVHIADS